MATFKRFEDIGAWQEARRLANGVYRASSQGLFAKDFCLRDQVRRAAVSILSNIAEGFERDGNKEFLQFLALAKGSSGELRAQLYLALDQGYLAESDFDELSGSTVKAGRMISGLQKYLRSSVMKGRKF